MMIMMHIRPFFSKFNIIIILNQQARSYSRDPFPSKVAHYLYRARLIDSIRLGLRSNCSDSLPCLLNDRLLDSFVVTQALRSAPSANSALSLVEELEKVQGFSHTKNTLHALATVLAKSHRTAELKSLIDAITAGRFGNVHVSFMNLMQWHAAAGDLESVLEFWDKYRFTAKKRACTESYNIVMALYAKKGMDSEAVKIFHRMLDEGANPNCRTYTVMIEHLVNSGKSLEAVEVFRVLPSMRIKRTLKQYSVLIESFIHLKRFEEVKTLLNEMQVDGILPSRAMCLSLQQIAEEGFLKDHEFFKESLSDERIKNIGYSIDSSDDDEDENENTSHACQYEDGKQLNLKP